MDERLEKENGGLSNENTHENPNVSLEDAQFEQECTQEELSDEQMGAEVANSFGVGRKGSGVSLHTHDRKT